MPQFISTYLKNVSNIAEKIDVPVMEQMVNELCALRDRGGRLFFLGVGGSAANCSHAVNDFRKLCGIEAYTPVDNVSELTARTNDEGWDTVFASWLTTSRANGRDAIFVFSVGGGDAENNVSPNIVKGLNEAKSRGLKVLGIVGRQGGHTKKVGDAVITIPTIDATQVTPFAESFQTVLWHCLVSHPKLQINTAKWEGISR